MGKRRGRWGALAAIPALVLTGFAIAASPASAATTPQWADWTELAGSGGNYSTSVQIAETPELSAEMQSDSRSGQIGVISGASTWLGPGTPVGEKYGSSRDQQYLNLRPKADTSTGASTTTYTFSRPTPTTNWTFVLGDIDADQVQVRAIGPDGVALTAEQLGYNGGFNYCAPGITGKPSCTGSANDVPQWDAATQTLTGNAAASDTAGSAGWFEPTAPMSSLTLEFTSRLGFPIYQTWFASLARDVTGTVTDASGTGAGVVLTLTDASGAIIGTTTTGPGGTYAFTGVQATEGYAVHAKAPEGKIVSGANAKPVDLGSADAVADFAIRDIVPVAVSGTVRDLDGAPVPGAIVTIPGVGEIATGPDGSYLFDEVPIGTYQPTVQLPGGYTVVTNPLPFAIDGSSEDPITDVDFVAVELPALSGTVSAGGSASPGVTVTAIGPGGDVLSTVTDADGNYEFPGLPAGEYRISIQVPDGAESVGPAERTVSVAAEDVANIDFELARAGSVSGMVTAGGMPVSGATLTLAGPDGPLIGLTTDEGVYDFSGLPAGDYLITVTPPEGFVVEGSASRSVTVTAAGEVFVDQDFVLVADAEGPGAGAGADAEADADATDAADADATAGAGADAAAGVGASADAGARADAGAGAGTAMGANVNGDGTGSSGLARTGTDFTPMLGVGGALLLVAAGTLLVLRRRGVIDE